MLIRNFIFEVSIEELKRHNTVKQIYPRTETPSPQSYFLPYNLFLFMLNQQTGNKAECKLFHPSRETISSLFYIQPWTDETSFTSFSLLHNFCVETNKKNRNMSNTRMRYIFPISWWDGCREYVLPYTFIGDNKTIERIWTDWVHVQKKGMSQNILMLTHDNLVATF